LLKNTGPVANKKIIEILTFDQRRHTPLSRLLNRSSHHESWTAQLRSVLEADLAPHCQVKNLQGNRLTIQVDDAGWATRIRFLIPELLPSLTLLADFAGVEEVRIQVTAVDPQTPSA